MFDAEFSVTALSYALIFCTTLFFYWYYWLYRGPYKQLPTDHQEFEGIFNTAFKKGPVSNVIFQLLLNTGKRYQKEGVCVLRFFRHFVLMYGEEFSKVLFNETAILDKSVMYTLVEDALGDGLLASNAELWKVHRKILNPGISMSYIISKIPLYNRKAQQLLNKLQKVEGVPTEVEKILSRCAFSILAESVLGFDADNEKMEAKVNKFIKAHHRGKEIFLERIPRPWLYFKSLLPWFKIGREHIECIEYVRSFTDEVIREMKISLPQMKQQSEDEQNSKKSIAQILLEEHLKGNLTMEEVGDHVRNFMIAGYDTIYTALTWCLYELGHHPEEQEKLYNEMQSVIAGKDVNYEELCRMQYADNVLKETLRLYPARPIYGRKLKKDVQCGKYKVPKESEVIFFPYLLHRNPDIYPEPYKFDPDRFSENSEIRPWMYLAFAEGLRYCIGKKFALLEMKVLLAHILRTYKVTSLTRVQESELDWRGELKCTKPIQLLLTRRDTKGAAKA